MKNLLHRKGKKRRPRSDVRTQQNNAKKEPPKLKKLEGVRGDC